MLIVNFFLNHLECSNIWTCILIGRMVQTVVPPAVRGRCSPRVWWSGFLRGRGCAGGPGRGTRQLRSGGCGFRWAPAPEADAGSWRPRPPAWRCCYSAGRGSAAGRGPIDPADGSVQWHCPVERWSGQDTDSMAKH